MRPMAGAIPGSSRLPQTPSVAKVQKLIDFGIKNGFAVHDFVEIPSAQSASIGMPGGVWLFMFRYLAISNRVFHNARYETRLRSIDARLSKGIPVCGFTRSSAMRKDDAASHLASRVEAFRFGTAC